VADTSLIFSIIARDKTSAVLEKIKRNASSTGSLVAKALGPAVAPVAAASTVAIVGMGAALISAGAAAGVFGAVMTTAITEITETATKFEDLNDKVKLYGKQAEIMAARGEDNSKMLKKQAAAALELEARLALLPPETRNATMAFMDMKGGWQAFVDTNKPATFNTLTNGYKLIGTVISKLQPFFDIGKAAADRLLRSLSLMVARGGIEKLAASAKPAMDTLVSILINLGRAVTGTFGKFVGQGQGVLKWIEEATAKWASWATATDQDSGINRLVGYVQQHGPAVMALLGGIAAAAVNISSAMAPLAPVSLAVAGGLAAIIAAIPPDVITALVAGYLAFNIALKAWAIGQAIATAAQWAWNVAMLANPITWIILAIVALIAIIVIIATKTTWFQTIWKYVWGFMKAVGAWFAGPFAGFFVMVWNKIVSGAKWVWSMVSAYFGFWYGLLGKIKGWVGSAVSWVTTKFGSLVGFIKGIPGKIGGALKNMFSPLWSGFRGFVNRIISGWNNLSFGLPGFSFAGISVPGISIGTPNIPYLAKGAGSVQQSGLAFIHRGEEVTPAARVTPYRSTSGGNGATITLKSDGSRMMNMLLEILREAIRDRGGDPVKVLTPR